MKLLPQVFGEIVSSLQKPVITSGDGAERRRAARIEMEAPVLATLLFGGQPGRKLRLLMRDISHSGIGVLCSVAANPADRMLVQLPRGRREPITLLAEVRICRALADGIYSIGAEFVQEMTLQESESLNFGQSEIQRIQNSILCGM